MKKRHKPNRDLEREKRQETLKNPKKTKKHQDSKNKRDEKI